MPISLSKGQKVDLTKTNPGLKNVIIGLGWDVNAFDSGADFDLDAAAFMVGADGRCPTEKEFIFYGNLAHPSESVTHMGDNLTGSGDGDDEQIKIDLSKVPAEITKSCQTASKAASYGIKFPFTVIFIKFAYNNCGFNRKVLSQVISDKFDTACLIYNSDKGI